MIVNRKYGWPTWLSAIASAVNDIWLVRNNTVFQKIRFIPPLTFQGGQDNVLLQAPFI